MNTVLIALIASLGPALLAVLTIRAQGREGRKNQRETWRRQDAVAQQAAEAAALLLAAQQDTILRTEQVAEHVAASTSATTAKLDVIHTLVNSTLTASLLAALDASRSELVTLLRMADMQREHGRDPSEDDLVAVASLRRKVGELSAAMQDREAQTRAAEVQIATEANRQANRQADDE